MAKRTTMKDIAVKLGLSLTTISQVLNDCEITVPESTKELIRRTAVEMDYRPNRIAASLANGKTKNIGLVIPDLLNIFFAELANYVGLAVCAKGYNLVLCTGGTEGEDLSTLKMLRSNIVDGIIGVFSNVDNAETIGEIEKLTACNIPVVLMDKRTSSLKAPHVGTDNFYGGYLAMKHLLENGHKRIAVIVGPRSSVSGQERYRGAVKALEEFGVTLEQDNVFYGDYSFESGYREGKKIVGCDFTAVFAGNDMMAYGLYRAAAEAGKKIGEDVSVVGFDDLFFSSMLEVPLTSIKQNVEEIASRAVEIIFDAINGKPIGEKAGLTLPLLSEKKSVAKLNV